ncbi:hypothetical protein FACS1894123_11790 [Bacteroidia bacterium]|nr:hypothetical protein FACS1894123_11790 [Bacteroidia bacterium]
MQIIKSNLYNCIKKTYLYIKILTLWLNEIDLLLENGGQLQAIEIKSSATMKNDFFNTLELFQSFSGIAKENISVIYGGDMDYATHKGKFISWRNF